MELTPELKEYQETVIKVATALVKSGRATMDNAIELAMELCMKHTKNFIQLLDDRKDGVVSTFPNAQKYIAELNRIEKNVKAVCDGRPARVIDYLEGIESKTLEEKITACRKQVDHFAEICYNMTYEEDLWLAKTWGETLKLYASLIQQKEGPSVITDIIKNTFN